MSDKRIVNIQLTKTKSVVAVEIGKNEYVDADGVTYKNIDTDFISDVDDVSEEEKHTFKYLLMALQSWKSRSVQLMRKSQPPKRKSKKQNLLSETCRAECPLPISRKRLAIDFRKDYSMRW